MQNVCRSSMLHYLCQTKGADRDIGRLTLNIVHTPSFRNCLFEKSQFSETPQEKKTMIVMILDSKSLKKGRKK